MSVFPVRQFDCDAAVAHVGEGLLACSLTRAEWTHEAHLAATMYLLVKHPEIDLDVELPGMIRRFNESVGGTNNDTQGYHDTITRAYLHGIRLFLAEADREAPIYDLVNDLLHSPMGHRDWPLRFFSRDRLMGASARRHWIEPDIRALGPDRP